MPNDDHPLNPNWAVGNSANGGQESDRDELNELKLKMMALQTKVQVLEIENKQFVEEKKIQEDKCSKLEKNIASSEEKLQKKIAELEMKNQKLTGESKALEEKLKKLEEMIQINQEKISETDNEIMVPIHEMKVQLPLENWHDLLAFVPRNQLGNVVSQIGDRQFAYIIQSFLHDPVRKITLGEMKIIRPRWNVFSDQPMVQVWPNTRTNIPDWPMPGNIKDFKEIDLKCFDNSVLNFLGKFQENSLLANVNLEFGENIGENFLRQKLNQILPMISSIDSLDIGYTQIEMVYGNKTNAGQSNESQLLLMEMMAKTRIVLIHWYVYGSRYSWKDKVNWYCSWLYTPRNDGKPRILRAYRESSPETTKYTCASFIERIKKDFVLANHPACFFFHTSIHRKDNYEDISFENVKTNEKLVIKKMEDDVLKLMVSRYPLNAAKNWIEAYEKEITDWNTSYTDLCRTINMNG